MAEAREREEEGQQRRMCSGHRGHGKSKMPLPEARRMESKSWAGVSWDASPQKLQREGEQKDGGMFLSEVTLHSWDPDSPPPSQGWAEVCLSLLGPLLALPGMRQLHGVRSPQQLKPYRKQKEGFRRKGGAGNLWVKI